MMLTPAELDRLTIHTAAELARKRRARGLKLNHPEAVALISDAVLEAARDGETLAEVISFGLTILTEDDVLPGVAEMASLICVEGLFDDGLKTITLWQPIRPGSETQVESMNPGEILTGDGEIELNAGAEKTEIVVTNTGDRPVHVASHFHFFEVNSELDFDRSAAFGKRLDVPAGATRRFEPGQSCAVTLTEIRGNGVVRGLNRLTEGSLHDPDVRDSALTRARTEKYRGA